MITRKDTNEMVGVSIVYPIMFDCEECIKIDKELGKIATSEYIHFIKLMLLFKSFGKYYEHK